ncbi:MAG TPA: ABC transporter ATP-binding protein [Gaiellaceae bacterium]|nr:ABC transporter ATP-binding protein [Gaiellaceae bacterium]
MSVAALDAVTKRFGQTVALTSATFAVERGEVAALLGANGAGKTTALALLLGLRQPDSGTARLFGLDPRVPAARRNVGVALQEPTFPTTLRVRELLALVRVHYPTPAPDAALLERFGLASLAPRQLGGLSGGERRRVAVALAFAGRPALVVLDEPTAGLDPDARRDVWAAVRAHAGDGGTILLTTHHLDEADALAHRVVLLDRGVVAADDSVAAIKAAAGLTRVRFRAPPGLAVEGAERDGDCLAILTRDAGAALEQLVRRGVPLAELEVRPLTLEEAIAARRLPP